MNSNCFISQPIYVKNIRTSPTSHYNTTSPQTAQKSYLLTSRVRFPLLPNRKPPTQPRPHRIFHTKPGNFDSTSAPEDARRVTDLLLHQLCRRCRVKRTNSKTKYSSPPSPRNSKCFRSPRVNLRRKLGVFAAVRPFVNRGFDL